MALAFAIAGGVVVALGLGAVGSYLEHRFRRFAELHREEAEGRAYLLSRVEVAISEAARATLAVSRVDHALISQRAADLDARKARALTDRRATIVRLRRARARRGTRS